MAILYDSATGRYLEVSPQDLRQLALQNPSLNAQAVASVNGARIGVRGTNAGQKAVLKANKAINFCKGGFNCINYHTVTYLPAGTVVGTTTGNSTWTFSYGNVTEIKLDVSLGVGYPAGTVGYIIDDGVTFITPTQGTFFPIQMGVTNERVKDLQYKLIACGFFTKGWTPDGDWGGATQTYMAAWGKTRFDNQSELDAFLNTDCSVISQKIRGAGGGGSNPPSGGGGTVDPNPLPAVPPAPAQDNTLLYGGLLLLGAVAIKNMGGKKKKKKKNR